MNEYICEDDLQMDAADLLWRCYPYLLWWHVPNGGKRSKREARRFKEMGVRPGVPDLNFVLADGSFAAIELKTKTGRLSDGQKRFQADALTRGVRYAVCRNLDDILSTLNAWDREGLLRPANPPHQDQT